LRAVVVDDEWDIAQYMGRLLTDAGVEVLGCCTNPYEALKLIRQQKPDVMFLDIEMPGLSGLQLAEQIESDKIDAEIIFVTAYDQFAIDAFRVNAIDYLLKPVTAELLNRSLERVRRRRYGNKGAGATSRNRQVSVSLFGRFRVYSDTGSGPIRWMTSKCAELFAFMLLQAGDKDVSKWQQIEALWNGKDLEKADINLRSTVSRVNKTLRDHQTGIMLVSTKNGYRMVIPDGLLMVDADQLEQLALNVHPIGPDSLGHVEQIIRHASQPLLQEFGSPWCEQYRSRYQQYFLLVGQRLLSYYEERESEPLKALQLAEMLIEQEPYNDALRLSALKLHHRLDGFRRASGYYHAYVSLLKTELGIEPVEKLSALYRSLKNG